MQQATSPSVMSYYNYLDNCPRPPPLHANSPTVCMFFGQANIGATAAAAAKDNVLERATDLLFLLLLLHFGIKPQ